MEITIKTADLVIIYKPLGEDLDVDFFLTDIDSHLKKIFKPKKSKGEVATRRHTNKNQNPNKENIIFIANLPVNTTESDLFDIFKHYGDIACICICKCKRNRAFIRYKTEESALSAIEENVYFRKVKLNISWAKPDKYSSPTGLKRPKGPGSLDFALDDLIKMNMSPVSIKECEIFDWVSQHGDCEYVY